MTEITEPAKQMAADLANAERERLGHAPDWAAEEFELGSVEIALARLCARFLAMQADMAEIASISHGGRDSALQAILAVRTIAARYRVEADPLAEALTKLDTITGNMTRAEYAALIRAELAKRGIALGAAK